MKKSILAFALLTIFGCSKPAFEKEWTSEKAPEKFRAKFETSKGDFEIEVERKLAPNGADRFYQLVSHHYFDNGIFYRVVPQYIAQFGNTDLAIMDQWRSVKVTDEPVIQSNRKGTVSFAQFGKDTRDLELFINLNDNPELDTAVVEGVKGYPSFGRVTKGMEVVSSLYSGYGEKTMSESEKMYAGRSGFLKSYPNLDLIKKAYLME